MNPCSVSVLCVQKLLTQSQCTELNTLINQSLNVSICIKALKPADFYFPETMYGRGKKKGK